MILVLYKMPSTNGIFESDFIHCDTGHGGVFQALDPRKAVSKDGVDEEGYGDATAARV